MIVQRSRNWWYIYTTHDALMHWCMVIKLPEVRSRVIVLSYYTCYYKFKIQNCCFADRMLMKKPATAFCYYKIQDFIVYRRRIDNNSNNNNNNNNNNNDDDDDDDGDFICLQNATWSCSRYQNVSRSNSIPIMWISMDGWRLVPSCRITLIDIGYY